MIGTISMVQAQCLREVLAAAIERLRLPDEEHAPGDSAALQYNILRQSYLLGMPNRQIMTRHSISEATFYRHRRRAIRILAQELREQEDILSKGLSE